MPIIQKSPASTETYRLLPVSIHVEARDAAKQLWREIFELTTGAGLGVELLQPKHTGKADMWGVEWKSGPEGWATVYADSPDSTAMEFEVFAKNGATVCFEGRS